MDLLKRETFDLYVYGTAQPQIDGRCSDMEYYSKNEMAVADEELREFARQIVELHDTFTLCHKHPFDRNEFKTHLQQMLQIVCAELGEHSQLASDIKCEIQNQDSSSRLLTSYYDSLARVRNVFSICDG